MAGILAVVLVVFIVMMGFSLLFPILPFWALNLGATPFEIGLIFSAYPVAQFIAAPLWGKFGDRFGYKWGIAVGTLGFAITSFLIPLVPAVWYLILVRFLGGLLSSAALPSSSAYVGAASPPDKVVRNFGFYGAALGSGMVFGPFIGGLAANFGLVVPFVISGVIGLLAFVVALLTVRNLKASGRGRRLSIRRLPLLKKVLVLMGFVGMLIMVNFEAILALLIKDRYGLGAREVGYLMGVAGLFGAAVQGNMGRIGRYLSERRAIALGFGVAAAVSLLVPLAPNFLILSALVVILVMASGITQPSVLSLLSRGTEGRGAIMGTYQSATSLGRIVGPPVAGFLYEVHYALPFAWAAALSLATVVSWSFYVRHLDPHKV
ncbi:MAG: MFS transporter [Thermotogae bacterium]|nr:MFS transporter [Thermotogota bacterium]